MVKLVKILLRSTDSIGYICCYGFVLMSHNVWCYVVVLMQHSTCYLLVRIITTELELKRNRFFFSFLCDGKNKFEKLKI